MVSTSEKQTQADRILDACEIKFLKMGFHRVPMDEVARELGMSKKTLYAHFAGKEALIEAMLGRRIARTDHAAQALLEADAPYGERLGGMIRLIHQRLSEVSPQFLEDIRRYAPQSFRIVEDYRSRAIPRFFGRLVEEGVESGNIVPSVDRELLICMLLACVQGILRPEILGAHGFSAQRAIDGILRIIFRGILTAGGQANCGKYFENP